MGENWPKVVTGPGIASMEGTGSPESSHPQPSQDGPIAFPYLVDIIVHPFCSSKASKYVCKNKRALSGFI